MAGILQEEYPFNFNKDPSSLQFLASSELVLNLWRFKYYSRPLTERDNDPSDSWFLENISCSCDDILVLPSCMKKTINEVIRKIKKQLWSWIEFHSIRQPSLFDDDFRDVFPNCFFSIVLNYAGSIGYKETASNLIKMSLLNNDEKYRLACMYCLEDDIRQIWPSVSNDVRLMNDNYSLIFYWNCRMSFTRDSITALTRFQRMNSSKCWEAFEYFFDLLTDQNKVSSTVSFFKHDHEEASLRSLRKLNRDLARDVFEFEACKILSTLVEKEEYRFHLRELWTVIKDIVFGNPAVFFDILNELWKRIFNGFSSNCVGLDQVNDLLIEVWTSAPDGLKWFILNRHIDKFFDNLISSENKFNLYYGHDMTFLLQLFINSSYEVRNKLWQKNWRKLVLRAKSFHLEQFMISVLLDENTIEEFKKRFMFDFKPIFKSLVEQGLFSDLNDYLCFLTKDVNLVQDYGKRALRSNVTAIVISLQNKEKARQFNEFLCSIFSNAVEDIDKFKEQLISSNRSIEILYKSLDPRRMKKFNVAVNALITSDKKLIEFKRKCLDFSRNYLISDQPHDFDSNKWQKWLEWCTADSKGFLAFKNSLNIDVILEKQIYNYGKKCDEYFTKFAGGLYFFNQIAEWYFADDQDRKKFKLRKIENYKKSSAIMDIIRRGPRKLITGMIYWFFDSDYDTGSEFLSRSGINLNF